MDNGIARPDSLMIAEGMSLMNAITREKNLAGLKVQWAYNLHTAPSAKSLPATNHLCQKGAGAGSDNKTKLPPKPGYAIPTPSRCL
jgi:hypothetical protein